MTPLLQQMMVGECYVLDESPAGWAVFSKDRTRRFALGRPLQRPLFASRPPSIAIVCGVNPSRAGARDNDLTITKTCELTRRQGCVQLLMVNLDPRIATDAAGLTPTDPEHWELDILRAFLLGVGTATTTTVVAWGAHHLATPARIEAMLAVLPKPPMCFGTTASGQPRHLSRLGYDTPMVPWEDPCPV